VTDMEGEVLAKFDARAKDPERWRQCATDLHSGALALWERLDQPAEAPEDQRVRQTEWLLSLGKVTLMLEGLALEALIKAQLVRKNPAKYVRGGKWVGQSHALVALARDAGLTCKNSAEADLLARLEGFVLWAGRYPVPLKDQDHAVRWEAYRAILPPGTSYSTADRTLSAGLFDRWFKEGMDGQTR
jgi:hypothetical protein